MQSHDDFRKDYKLLKNEVDDLDIDMPEPSNVRHKREEIARLKRKIEDRLNSLRSCLGSSNGKSAPMTAKKEQECQSQMQRWEELQTRVDDYAKACDDC